MYGFEPDGGREPEPEETHGYRRITVLRQAGLQMNKKQVERMWR